VFKYTLQTPTTRRDASYKLNVVSETRCGDYRVGPRFSGVTLWAVITLQTMSNYVHWPISPLKNPKFRLFLVATPSDVIHRFRRRRIGAMQGARAIGGAARSRGKYSSQTAATFSKWRRMTGVNVVTLAKFFMTPAPSIQTRRHLSAARL